MITEKSYNANIRGIRNFFLGEESPQWYSQIIVLTGFLTWIWFFFGYLLGLLALKIVQGNAEVKVRESFERIGEKYGLSDVMDLYANMTITGLIGAVMMMTGLIFIWRRWLAGYFIFLPGLVLCIISPMIFMSYEYLVHEHTPAEYILPAIVFLLFLFDFYKWKSER